MALENAALRQQLAIYQRTHIHPRLRAGDRFFWVLLHRLWSDWSHLLIIVKPATVIGRLCIPRKHISFIKRISGDHPEWGEDKIAEELVANFGIEHSTSTIRFCRFSDQDNYALHLISSWSFPEVPTGRLVPM